MLYAVIDGACSPNPGGVCSCAFIIRNSTNEVITQFSKRIGEGIGFTNNVGEYYALIEVLKWFSTRLEKELTVASDSQLVINQMTGKWKSASGVYIEAQKIAINHYNSLLENGKRIIFRWVPREYTIDVDRLAGLAIHGSSRTN